MKPPPPARFPERLLFLGLILICCACAGRSEAPAPPNVVLILSDDHAWTDYGFMGHPQVQTPNLDTLAAQSVVFPRGYVPSSLCSPSIASIMTGLHARDNGIWSNDPPLSKGVTPPFGKNPKPHPQYVAGREVMDARMRAHRTLPRLLAENGYLTMQTGKWWQGHYSNGGFTHGMTQGGPAGRHGGEGLVIGRETMQPVWDFFAQAKREAKPFLLCHMPMLPHDPHTPPHDLLEKYRKLTPHETVAKYWAMVEFFDRNVGELLGRLQSEGLAENTIVLYVADNGYIQKPDGKGTAPKSKQSPHDGGLRTPIMIRWPGHLTPRTEMQPVISLDILPTVLAALKISVPTLLPGVNLLDPAAVRARPHIIGDCYVHSAVDLDHPAKSLRWRWILAGDWKLVLPDATNEPEWPVQLFHVGADPFETTNLAQTRPERVNELRAKLDAWWKAPTPRFR
jgi:uncharacterized sulfatase